MNRNRQQELKTIEDATFYSENFKKWFVFFLFNCPQAKAA
jgi:hypothetical protein